MWRKKHFTLSPFSVAYYWPLVLTTYSFKNHFSVSGQAEIWLWTNHQNSNNSINVYPSASLSLFLLKAEKILSWMLEVLFNSPQCWSRNKTGKSHTLWYEVKLFHTMFTSVKEATEIFVPMYHLEIQKTIET